MLPASSLDSLLLRAAHPGSEEGELHDLVSIVLRRLARTIRLHSLRHAHSAQLEGLYDAAGRRKGELARGMQASACPLWTHRLQGKQCDITSR